MTITISRPLRSPEPVEALPTTDGDALRVRPRAHREWDPVRFTGPERAEERAKPGPDPRRIADPEPAELPDATAWSGTVVRAAVEVLRGQRPAAQLSRWIDAEIFHALNRRALLGIEVHGRPARPVPVRVRRVHPCRLSAEIWECSVVVHDGERTRAAAIRLEARRGRWRATALSIG